MSNLFIEIPLGTLCCFLFLFFTFLNTVKTKSVRSMQLMLLCCIMWTAGDLFTRLKIYPGVHFWYSVSLLGLLMIPVYIYYFLFQILGIQNQLVLLIYSLVSFFIAVANAVSGLFLDETQTLRSKGGAEAYAYSNNPVVYSLIAFEVIVLVCIIAFVYRKIKNDVTTGKKLVPLLVGISFILIGNVLETVSINKFPYGSLGGVVLAGCVTCMIYRQYLFDISKRLQIGAIYMLASFLIFIPIWHVSKNLDRLTDLISLPLEEILVITGVVLLLWALLAGLPVIALANRLEQRESEKQFEQLQVFQQETLSVFDIYELCQKILEIVPELVQNANAVIALRNDAANMFDLADSESGGALMQETEKEIMASYQNAVGKDSSGVMEIRCNDTFQGYLHIKRKRKLNYMEVEYFRQLVSHIGICMKNIQIYQKRYQMTIHDDLTGLYNRKYFSEYMKRHWDKKDAYAFLYMDIDNFKLFNDIYGEESGDNVLKWCGKVIQDMAGSKGKVFRMGSNEYLACVSGMGRKDALQMAEGIRKNLRENTDDRPKVLQPVTMSIGIAMKTTGASGYNELLRWAERAAFFAKQKGKDCIEIYGDTKESGKGKPEGISAFEQISSTVYALTAAINAKDSYTFDHSMNVSKYAVLLARELGLDKNEVRIVKEAGMLHDIGKIGIPEHILQKEGPLTKEEYETMKTHVTKSVEMIHFLPNMNYVIPAVLSHHERYDGKGYPRGIAGNEIPLLGRILTVCDCYDAIISRRSYKAAYSKNYAIGELQKNKGTQFDPDLVDVFVTLIPHLDRQGEKDGRVG